MKINDADQHHVLYHLPGGYSRGEHHLHRFRLTATPGPLQGTFNVAYLSLGSPGPHDLSGKFSFEATDALESLRRAKLQLDSQYPELEGTLVAFGIAASIEEGDVS